MLKGYARNRVQASGALYCHRIESFPLALAELNCKQVRFEHDESESHRPACQR